MTVNFRPAVRENVGLWINIIGGTGSGKTMSALRLASGIAGDKPFAFIDTENRRGLHYADQFNFDHADLQNFSPADYIEAIEAADKAGYPVIVVDSFSHVWAGLNGVLDMQEAEFKRLGSKDSVKMLSWAKPKKEHKRLRDTLLRVKAHVILCLRAEEKIEMVRGENGKTEIRPKASMTGKGGWIPICEKNLPFEATCSFLLHAEEPGIPDPIKLQEQHVHLFPPGKLIDESAGERLAIWAKGGGVMDFATKRDNMLEYFTKQGVTAERILALVGRTDVKDLTEADIAILRQKAADIKGGKAIDTVFPVAQNANSRDEKAPTSDSEGETLTTEPSEPEIEEYTMTPSDQEANLRGNAIARLETLGALANDVLDGRTLDTMNLAALKGLHAELDELEKEHA